MHMQHVSNPGTSSVKRGRTYLPPPPDAALPSSDAESGMSLAKMRTSWRISSIGPRRAAREFLCSRFCTLGCFAGCACSRSCRKCSCCRYCCCRYCCCSVFCLCCSGQNGSNNTFGHGRSAIVYRRRAMSCSSGRFRSRVGISEPSCLHRVPRGRGRGVST